MASGDIGGTGCKDLNRDKILKTPFGIVDEGLEEPEVVTDHLVALGGDDFENFIAARIDLPYHDCDEKTLLMLDDKGLGIPEKQAIIEFGKEELGLNDDWAGQLVDDCVLY